MGSGSSREPPKRPEQQHHDDGLFSQAAMARRADKIRQMFPIATPIEDASSPDHTAFVSSDSPSLFTTLPPELIEKIVNHLDNRSIKSLRLTCKRFGTIALRINRVFLSANLLNIQVFRSIADHDFYRQGITEIIYDDALFYRSFDDQWAESNEWSSLSYPFLELSIDKNWFYTERDDHISELKNRQLTDRPGRPENVIRALQARAELSFSESWTHYQDLLSQQDEVFASGADAEALRYGLRRFPALQRVTITPAAHGWLFTPLYQTPMIRAFPYGFNYPIPRGWPTRRAGEATEFDKPWEDSKTKWRGYCLVTEILAQERHHHRVSELFIDAHYLHTGVNCQLFEQRCQEYLNFRSILQQPNLKKLQLSLNVDGQERFWLAFRSGQLRSALAEASHLEHFSMETNWDANYYRAETLPPALGSFLPLDRWTGLRHFRLWNFPVVCADLIWALSQLTGLQSLELGFLSLYPASNFELLNEMRDSLRWHEWLTPPRVDYAVPIPGENTQGRAIWLHEAVTNFLYYDDANPFDSATGKVARGVGIIRDAYDSTYERPYD
ncbi:F-box domain-containing protein [Trichoderma simmonsii]|uniref:F-box domain-containing protein n=1 Tax=Trichoderma simmonsii TaxID=1491479 RepID=A0A8G0LS13_9HYPO|nr:F-box domain-containing protein [Trichoderma simmonsii]